VATRLVDDDEPTRVETFRKLDEPAPGCLDAGLGLLYGVEALFRVSASFGNTWFIDDRLTAWPVRRSVRSGFSPTIARTTWGWSGATRGGLPPAADGSGLALQALPPANGGLADLEQRRRFRVRHASVVERGNHALAKIDRVRPPHRPPPPKARVRDRARLSIGQDMCSCGSSVGCPHSASNAARIRSSTFFRDVPLVCS
jgi:hypothetical protein